MAVAAGAISRMPAALGVPLTKTVARAQPGGKLIAGRETKELVCQLVDDRNKTWPVSMLRNCTTGQSPAESCEPLPPEPSDTPRNLAPVSARLSPRLRGELRVAICAGREPAKPRPTSYNSDVELVVKSATWPPATSTFPLGNNAAMWPTRTVPSGAVSVHFPVIGSNSSELDRTFWLPSMPPATSTFPLGSSVAVGNRRATFIEPTVVHFPLGPLAGSNTSALA